MFPFNNIQTHQKIRFCDAFQKKEGNLEIAWNGFKKNLKLEDKIDITESLSAGRR